MREGKFKLSEKKTSSKHAGKKSGRYNPEEKTKELIQNINKICEIRGISHYTLAKRADISTSTLHSLLAGKTKPYMYTVYRLCNALDIATRINTHSVYFTCIKDDKLYTYGYNTNNIQEDTVDYEEDGEYYDYAYGTRNYDDAIGEYSEVGEIIFEKVSEDKAIVNDEAESDENDAPTAYRNLIEKYETEYGSANLNEQEQFWTGLCFAKLLDFNGDGVDELILAYQTEPSNIDNVEYTVELWEFDGTSVERVASQISWTGNNIPYFGGFSISKYEEKYLLVLTDNAGGDISYYGTKDDGSIGLVHELIWKGDAMEGDWYLDDEMISRETYEEYYNKYRSDSIWYGFSEESCNETIQEEISQTKDKLKM